MHFARKPPSMKNTTQITQQQISQVGCCFNILPPKNRQTASALPYRSYSQPKKTKINVTIARRGNTQEKQVRRQGTILPAKKSFSMAELKFVQTATGYSSLTSKSTTQKNSLRNSRVKICNEVSNNQITPTNRYDKFINICSDVKSKQMEVTFNQSRIQMPSSNIHMLSEISLVQEEFISNQSTTLKALNLLSNYSDKKTSSKYGSPSRKGLETIREMKSQETKEVKNPLQRLLQKKRIGNPDKAKLRL